MQQLSSLNYNFYKKQHTLYQ